MKFSTVLRCWLLLQTAAASENSLQHWEIKISLILKIDFCSLNIIQYCLKRVLESKGFFRVLKETTAFKNEFHPTPNALFIRLPLNWHNYHIAAANFHANCCQWVFHSQPFALITISSHCFTVIPRHCTSRASSFVLFFIPLIGQRFVPCSKKSTLLVGNGSFACELCNLL